MTAPDRIALRWEPGAAVTNGPLMTHPDYINYLQATPAREAAEELMAALERAEAYIRTGMFDRAGPVLRQAKAAIAKARGQA